MQKKDATRRRLNIRHKNWDYSIPGAYFVTICTKNQKMFFQSESIKKIVGDIWMSIPKHHENTGLDEFVVTANHIHGIVYIYDASRATARRGPTNKFGKPMIGTLPTIIRSFKSETTKILHKLGLVNFFWQPRYYDHIVRTERSLNAIRNYIRYNPLQWEHDKENPKAIDTTKDRNFWKDLKKM